MRPPTAVDWRTLAAGGKGANSFASLAGVEAVDSAAPPPRPVSGAAPGEAGPGRAPPRPAAAPRRPPRPPTPGGRARPGRNGGRSWAGSEARHLPRRLGQRARRRNGPRATRARSRRGRIARSAQAPDATGPLVGVRRRRSAGRRPGGRGVGTVSASANAPHGAVSRRAERAGLLGPSPPEAPTGPVRPMDRPSPPRRGWRQRSPPTAGLTSPDLSPLDRSRRAPRVAGRAPSPCDGTPDVRPPAAQGGGWPDVPARGRACSTACLAKPLRRWGISSRDGRRTTGGGPPGSAASRRPAEARPGVV